MIILKKALLLSCLLSLNCLLLQPLSAGAQEHPRIYTIKKGDTLWGISQRFIKDPQYWPNLWSHNPFVRNPHFIYPGQKVAIVDGKLLFLPADGQLPSSVDQTAGTELPLLLPEPQQEITIKTNAAAEGFISTEELNAAGTLVDATDARLLMAENDRVFIAMESGDHLQPGDLQTLVQVGRKIKHPVTGETLGHHIIFLGKARIREITPPVITADIVSSEKEIMRGARLLPDPPRKRTISLKKALVPLTGYVVASEDEKIALSQHDIIHVDLGSENGLLEGNMLYITRPRERSESALKNHNMPLPDALLGAAVVVNVQRRTASALILKSTGAIYAGDRVVTPAD
jgi:LysM repeat protein